MGIDASADIFVHLLEHVAVALVDECPGQGVVCIELFALLREDVGRCQCAHDPHLKFVNASFPLLPNESISPNSLGSAPVAITRSSNEVVDPLSGTSSKIPRPMAHRMAEFRAFWIYQSG
jgi:hypothetical protein